MVVAHRERERQLDHPSSNPNSGQRMQRQISQAEPLPIPQILQMEDRLGRIGQLQNARQFAHTTELPDDQLIHLQHGAQGHRAHIPQDDIALDPAEKLLRWSGQRAQSNIVCSTRQSIQLHFLVPRAFGILSALRRFPLDRARSPLRLQDLRMPRQVFPQETFFPASIGGTHFPRQPIARG